MAESQRGRIVRAMLDCVARQGYVPTTVADVVAAARVSRNSFYEHFADKEACFVAGCDEKSERFLAALLAHVAEPNWLDALRKGLHHYLQAWVDDREFAIAYLVDFPTAGRRALEQRDRSYAQFAAMFDALAVRARAEQPDLPPLRPLASRFLVTSIPELLAQEIRAGRVEKLVALEDDLLFLVVQTIADDATARAAAGDRERSRRIRVAPVKPLSTPEAVERRLRDDPNVDERAAKALADGFRTMYETLAAE